MKNLANTITGFRILLGPIIFSCIIQSKGVALFLYLFALFTDVLDGFVARHTDTVSKLGAFLDVSADFLLVAAGAIGFYVIGLFELWVLGVIGLMFAQFILGFGGRIVYDPFGKTFGIFSLICVPLVMAFPLMGVLVKYSLLFLGLGSFFGRRIYLMHLYQTNGYANSTGNYLWCIPGLSM